jgi:hypothetical protein
MEDLGTLELIKQEVEEKDGILTITAHYRKVVHLNWITVTMKIKKDGE